MKKVATLAILITVSLAASATGCRKQSHAPAVSQNNTANPTPPGPLEYITDAANVIDHASRNQLETTLAELKRRDGIDFSVVTVASTGSQSAFDYSLALARERKNIKHENNRAALLLLVAVEDRNWHIQITRNLEASLTNEVLTKLSEPMTELFRQKRYGEGIVKYVDRVIAKLAAVRPTLEVTPANP